MKRSTVALLVIATIVIGAGVGYGASQVLGDDDPEPTSTTSGGPTGDATTPDPESTLLDYSDVGDAGEVFIDDPDDLSAIADAPQDFRDFTQTVVRELIEQNQSSCPDGAIGMGVSRIMPNAGFATGGINACGGYVAIWKRESTGWKEIIGTQDAFSCDELHDNGVPVSLFSDPSCVTEDSGGRLVGYTG